MLLGIFKRVALYKAHRRKQQLKDRIQSLLDMDSSSPDLPLLMALFWRDYSAEPFVNIPSGSLLTQHVTIRIDRFDRIAEILKKVNILIGADEYESLMAYLNRLFRSEHSITLANYFTDVKGFPIPLVDNYKEISRILFELASVVEGLDSYEYHRALNMVYRDMLKIVQVILDIT